MTVNEALAILQDIQDHGYGEYPIQLMEVDNGITFAKDIEILMAEKFDGERVWVYSTEKHDPAWLKHVRNDEHP